MIYLRFTSITLLFYFLPLDSLFYITSSKDFYNLLEGFFVGRKFYSFTLYTGLSKTEQI